MHVRVGLNLRNGWMDVRVGLNLHNGWMDRWMDVRCVLKVFYGSRIGRLNIEEIEQTNYSRFIQPVIYLYHL